MDTSEWTLDYPPFFAWFEYLLSQFAKYFDREMLKIENLNYSSTETIYFQRLSVIVSEILFFFAAKRIASLMESKSGRRITFFSLIFLNPGLLFVDNIHFQYNGFMYGLQLYSVIYIYEKKYLLAAVLFATVLNFKHIYLYQAPAYFIALLRLYCFQGSNYDSFSLLNFTKLGITTISVFLASFGPFYNHVPQILSRLFPFKRGLCHAYWAPNFWALYSGCDRGLVFVCRVLKICKVANTASLTRGLVGDTVFSVVPDIKPSYTAILTLLFDIPTLIKLWKKPTAQNFLNALIMCGFNSYMFGWHVHEKAILLVLIPLTLRVRDSEFYGRIFYIIGCTGYLSLFPLLFRPDELLIKFTVLGLFVTLSEPLIKKFYGKNKLITLNYEKLYLYGLIVVAVYTEIVHPLLVLKVGGFERLEFLPLLVVSCYCGLGVLYCWGMLLLFGEGN
ncbi:glycosyl transferase [Nowakowskiella sp. JEL0407]|nr:glycosyl transferase [Nowakowskiella sp. JEL0407]